MKWTAVTLDLSRIRKFGQKAGLLSRPFVTLGSCTLLMFAVVGVGGYLQAQANTSPDRSMRGLASSVSSDFFLDMIGLEVPHLNDAKPASAFSQRNVFSFIFRMLTDINPKDPKTMVARELPGIGANAATLLSKGAGVGDGDSPIDYTSSLGQASLGSNPSASAAPPSSQPTNAPGNGTTAGAGPTPATSTAPAASASPGPTSSPAAAADPASASLDKLVLIYHSHDRESWVPELGVKDPNDAYSVKTNITLVGQYLADKLQKLGVGAIDDNTDYPATVKDFNYAYSYKYSAQTVKKDMSDYPDLQYLFDIHRDDQPRDKTTVTINGKAYAQVFFIIGQKNPHWKDNYQFATDLQNDLEKKMAGITRGVWGKSANEGNGEYNQSVSDQALLIEIGGPYNTLQECYRTADVLAAVIADRVHSDEAAKTAAGSTGTGGSQ